MVSCAAAGVATGAVLCAISPSQCVKLVTDSCKIAGDAISDFIGPYFNEEDNDRSKNPPKSESPVWNGDDLIPDRGGRKNNGKKGKKKEIYEWDHTHDDIEVYNGKGKHKGSMNPTTGDMYKPPVPGRTIDI